MGTSRIKKIYLIDDSDDEIFMAKIFFKRQQIAAELVAFSRLEDLYDVVENDPTFNPNEALIVIDLNLTVCKGTEGIVHIRQVETDEKVLVGISTGSEDPADKLLAADAGADFFVGKPLDRAMILAIADNVSELTAQEDDGHSLNLYRN